MRVRTPLVIALFTLLTVALGTQTASAVTSTYRIKYEQVLFESLYLDVHVPDGPGPFPVIVWLHSGAWITGDRGGGYALRQAERGYAVVSIDYRLAPIWVYPAQIQDCKNAVRWIRANASQYHFDPDRVGVMGASAGGHLASLLGTTGGVAELEGASLGNAAYSSRVKAVVDYYGPSDLLQIEEQKLPCYPIDGNDPYMPPSLLIGCAIQQCPDKADKANPIKFITPDDPPFLILQGTADCLVPWQQSEILYEALKAAGKNVELHLIQGGEHGGPPFHDPRYDAAVDRFLDTYLKGEPPPQRRRTGGR